MASERQSFPPADKRRALALLKAGKVSLPEVAQVLGASTQTVWNWCKASGTDWRKARLTQVMREWKRAPK